MKNRVIEGILQHYFNARNDWGNLLRQSVVSRKVFWLLVALLCLYTSIVAYLSLAGPVPSLLSFPVLLFIVFILLAKVFSWLWCLESQVVEGESNEDRKTSWKVFGVISLGYVLYTLLCGCWNNGDTCWQWQQVCEGHFHDWHPIIHTWLLWCIARLWENYQFVVCVQGVIFGGLCGWLYRTMRYYGYKKFLVWFTILFIALSPGTQEGLRILWKDTAFALACLALTVIEFHLWHTYGQWLNRPIHLVLFLAVIVLVSFLRHNGVFLSGAFLLLLPLLGKEWRGRLKLMMVALLSFALILGYIEFRSRLIKEKIVSVDSGQQYFEAIGVPLTILGANMLYSQNKIPQDIQEVLLAMGSENDWHLYYRGNGFHDGENALGALKDHLKYRDVLGERFTLYEFLKMTLRVVRCSPVTSAKAFLNLTSIAWNPLFQRRVLVPNRIPGYPLDYIMSGIRGDLLNVPLGWFFLAPGMHVLCLLIAGMLGVCRHGCRSLVIILPFIVYAAGTSLLLFSNLESWRYFYALCLCSVPCIAMIFSSVNEKKKECRR